MAPSIALAYGGPTQSLVGFVRAARAVGADVTIAAPMGSAADAEWMSGALPGVRLRLFPSFGRAAFVASPQLLRYLRTEAASSIMNSG